MYAGCTKHIAKLNVASGMGTPKSDYLENKLVISYNVVKGKNTYF
jgi:hypothetical protein